MNLFLKICSFFILVIFMNACKNDATHLSGTIRNAGSTEATFDEITYSQTNEIQKVKLNPDGSYNITLAKKLTPGIYRLKVAGKQMNLILNGKERDIKLDADFSALQTTQYSVLGAEDTQTYLDVMNDVQSGKKTPEALKQFVETTSNPLVAMLVALNVKEFASPEYLPTMTNIADKLNKTYPGSSYAKDFSQTLMQLRRFLADNQNAATPIKIGSVAPEIAMSTPDDKILKLSDLKGKVVLLDFWASWCGPCRRSNPSLVRTYQKYKSKGFDVFSVSLDKNKDAWLSAIEKDGLVWKNHVSDLNGWDNAAAVQYNVRGIPQQYLLDKTGKIISVAEAGASIESAIEKALQ